MSINTLVMGLEMAIALAAIYAFRECWQRREKTRQGEWHKRGAMAFHLGFFLFFMPVAAGLTASSVRALQMVALLLFLTGVASHWVARADRTECIKIGLSMAVFAATMVFLAGVSA
jgi:hypothetical protein